MKTVADYLDKISHYNFDREKELNEIDMALDERYPDGLGRLRRPSLDEEYLTDEEYVNLLGFSKDHLLENTYGDLNQKYPNKLKESDKIVLDVIHEFEENYKKKINQTNNDVTYTMESSLKLSELNYKYIILFFFADDNDEINELKDDLKYELRHEITFTKIIKNFVKDLYIQNILDGFSEVYDENIDDIEEFIEDIKNSDRFQLFVERAESARTEESLTKITNEILDFDWSFLRKE